MADTDSQRMKIFGIGLYIRLSVHHGAELMLAQLTLADVTASAQFLEDLPQAISNWPIITLGLSFYT